MASVCDAAPPLLELGTLPQPLHFDFEGITDEWYLLMRMQRSPQIVLQDPIDRGLKPTTSDSP